MLVDRHPLFLAAVAEVIRPVCPRAVIQTTTDPEQALAVAVERGVDLLLCDVRSAPLNGADLATRIRERGLPTTVVLLGDAEDRPLLVDSMGCGAAGFFTKDAAAEDFSEGLRAVIAGHLVLCRELLQLILERLADSTHSDSRGRLSRLSQAERRILIMIGQAQSTRAIAFSRGISEKTVRNHLASIYRKLRIRNRSEAIVWSARADLGREPIPSSSDAPT
jgi:DNA-binding NarL/FixJ family response regulator